MAEIDDLGEVLEGTLIEPDSTRPIPPATNSRSPTGSCPTSLRR